MAQRFATLGGMLAAAARDDRRIAFLEGEGEQRVMSFARLRQRATALLGALQRLGVAPGDALVMSLADNERFVEMFWAGVLGGAVPVPLAPVAADETARKVLRVLAQHRRAWLFADAGTLARLEAVASADGLPFDLPRERVIVPGSLDVSGGAGREHVAAPGDLAFIQYSSGSTGEPKGVLLTHANLDANIAAIIEAAAFTERDVALSWMPLSHDMGLIGFHLNMLAAGVEHVLMRTELFARRPLLWLLEASRRRATVLCSPNFGYQHYLRQHARESSRAKLQGLDLSSVRLVFNGAEPISAELCRRFTQTMAAHGLPAGSMYPVYGLAEASLAVSFPKPGAPLSTLRVDPAGLAVGEPVRLVGGDGGTEFVTVGRPVSGFELQIADAADAPLPAGHHGRIRVRGPSVSRGYWGHGAALAADGWLDTGDLGFVHDGALAVTGRAKDIVFVNGQNVYPHDIERLAERVDGIEAQRVAAAGIAAEAGEGEALALFVVHRGPLEMFAPRAAALRRSIQRETGLDVAEVVPVPSIPKTTSGKMRRYALVEAHARGEFAADLARLRAIEPAGGDVAEAAVATTEHRLVALCAATVPDRRFDADTHLLEIDLSSLALARIHEAVEREFPGRVDVTDLFEYPTLAELARFLDRDRGSSVP